MPHCPSAHLSFRPKFYIKEKLTDVSPSKRSFGEVWHTCLQQRGRGPYLGPRCRWEEAPEGHEFPRASKICSDSEAIINNIVIIMVIVTVRLHKVEYLFWRLSDAPACPTFPILAPSHHLHHLHYRHQSVLIRFQLNWLLHNIW